MPIDGMVGLWRWPILRSYGLALRIFGIESLDQTKKFFSVDLLANPLGKGCAVVRQSIDLALLAALIAGPIAMLPGPGSGQVKLEAACPKGAFCDSFEDAAIGGMPGGIWTVERRGDPVIRVDDKEAYLGRQSVKIRALGRETAFLSLKGAPLFPLVDNILYGRSMMKLESAPNRRVHWTIIEGKGMSKEGDEIIEYRYGGAKPIDKDGVFIGSRLMANYETPQGAKTDCWHAAKNRTVMPTGRWVCLAFAFDGQQNSMKLWLDGKLLDDLSVTGVGQGCMHAADDYRWQAPMFDQINLGWETYKDDEARTLWIDDVAISDRPLSCPDQ